MRPPTYRLRAGFAKRFGGFRQTLLEPEQEQLLGTLVEASRTVADRNKREFFLMLLEQGALVAGGGLPHDGPMVADGDIEVLAAAGLLLRKAVLMLSTSIITLLALIWVARYAVLGLWIPAAIPLAY